MFFCMLRRCELRAVCLHCVARPSAASKSRTELVPFEMNGPWVGTEQVPFYFLRETTSNHAITDVVVRQAGVRAFLVLVLSGAVLVLLLEWAFMTEPIFDHEKLDVYRLSIEYVNESHHATTSGRKPPWIPPDYQPEPTAAQLALRNKT